MMMLFEREERRKLSCPITIFSFSSNRYMGNTSSTSSNSNSKNNKSISVEELSHIHSEFNVKQLSVIHSQFISRFPSTSTSNGSTSNGSIMKREDLHFIFKRYFPFADDYSFVDYLFSVLDRNGDSVVDFEEFLFFYELLVLNGSRGRREELKKYLFDGRDLNGIMTSYKKLTVGFTQTHSSSNDNEDYDEDPLLIQEFLLDSINSTFPQSSSSLHNLNNSI
jgi:Ca2+-binding EF-hand superfamily protein